MVASRFDDRQKPFRWRWSLIRHTGNDRQSRKLSHFSRSGWQIWCRPVIVFARISASGMCLTVAGFVPRFAVRTVPEAGLQPIRYGAVRENRVCSFHPRHFPEAGRRIARMTIRLFRAAAVRCTVTVWNFLGRSVVPVYSEGNIGLSVSTVRSCKRNRSSLAGWV